MSVGRRERKKCAIFGVQERVGKEGKGRKKKREREREGGEMVDKTDSCLYCLDEEGHPKTTTKNEKKNNAQSELASLLMLFRL